jgi:hypothetical protein
MQQAAVSALIWVGSAIAVGLLAWGLVGAPLTVLIQDGPDEAALVFLGCVGNMVWAFVPAVVSGIVCFPLALFWMRASDVREEFLDKLIPPVVVAAAFSIGIAWFAKDATLLPGIFITYVVGISVPRIWTPFLKTDEPLPDPWKKAD